MLVFLLIGFTFAVHRQNQMLRECVDHGHADAVQAA